MNKKFPIKMLISPVLFVVIIVGFGYLAETTKLIQGHSTLTFGLIILIPSILLAFFSELFFVPKAILSLRHDATQRTIVNFAALGIGAMYIAGCCALLLWVSSRI